MDPTDPTSFNHRTERLSTGRSYHFIDEKPSGYDPITTLTMLCVHGFPDIWYGWRFQIGPWVRKGYRVIVPDMLGYGGTDKPRAVEEYTTKRLSDDLAALLGLVGVQKAIVIGHDWGSYTVSRFALWHPYRLLALAILAVPYAPRAAEYTPLEEFVKKVPNYGYQLYFSDPISTTEIEANLSHFLRVMYGMVKPSKSLVPENHLRQIIQTRDGVPNETKVASERELQYYLSQLQDMNGPLNYYRTTKLRFEEEEAAHLPRELRADLPVLFLGGSKDFTGTPWQVESSRKYIARLQDAMIEGVGHWLMAEARQEVTERVIEWSESVLPEQAFQYSFSALNQRRIQSCIKAILMRLFFESTPVSRCSST